jgi:hypothetical protein
MHLSTVLPFLVPFSWLEKVRILTSGALPNWLTDWTVGRRSDLSSLACERSVQLKQQLTSQIQLGCAANLYLRFL